jgi:hypothetical protein
MQSEEIKKGIIKYIDFRRASKFVFLESMILCGLFTWYAVKNLHWSGISTFILCFCLLAFISTSPIYKVLNIILSFVWGTLGFCIGFIVGMETIGRTLPFSSFIVDIIFGIIGFLIAFRVSYKIREDARV